MERVAGCEAMQGQKGILVLSPDNTLRFLHMCGKLAASFVSPRIRRGTSLINVADKAFIIIPI